MKIKTLVASLLLFGIPVIFTAGADSADYFLLDDFSRGNSRVGTSWENFADRVMGGKSQINTIIMKEKGESFLRLQGNVSLENRGGFIQTRLKLTESSGFFDGTPYSGVRLIARGSGSGYYIYLRNNKTGLPWKYYSAPIPVSSNWTEIYISWNSFTGGDYGQVPPLKVNKLKSIAVAAANKEFTAEIDVKEIGFY